MSMLVSMNTNAYQSVPLGDNNAKVLSFCQVWFSTCIYIVLGITCVSCHLSKCFVRVFVNTSSFFGEPAGSYKHHVNKLAPVT